MSEAAPRRLWLVRHAQPLVAPGLCYGALDVAVNAQATQDAAQQLANALPAQAHVCYSTLQRCEQLALALKAQRPDLAITADARLREMDFGTWEGQTWDAIGEPAVTAWTVNFATHAPGGGESLGTMLARVASALEGAQSNAAPEVVWITHAGVARCVDWLLSRGSALPQACEWPLVAPGYGECVVRDISGWGVSTPAVGRCPLHGYKSRET